MRMVRLYIVRFLHQTTTVAIAERTLEGCISSVSYIKPQPNDTLQLLRAVVYRPFPTSNHNSDIKIVRELALYIVRFLHQTTTIPSGTQQRCLLYIVRFLHQTTTFIRHECSFLSCISSVSYIKPQPLIISQYIRASCISSVSYIKPQPMGLFGDISFSCISSVSYIKPQPCEDAPTSFGSCISSVSYIKPQLLGFRLAFALGCISSVSYIKPQPTKIIFANG